MELLRFRTIGEILYELLTGLVFYPRTLWRVLMWPTEARTAVGGAVGAGADRDAAPGAPPDLVSPPLFLLLSILLGHALDLALRGGVAGATGTPDLGPLLFRVAAFTLFPLVMATGTLRRQGRPIDHATLREPFDRQCQCAAPFALSVSVAAILAGSTVQPIRLAGAAIGLAAVAWYLCVQTRWLSQRLDIGGFRAFWSAAWLFAVALAGCLPPALLALGQRSAASG